MRKSTVLHIILALLTIAAVVGGFTSFQRKRSSFERLDFQFHWANKVAIVDAVDSGSDAQRAGLRPGDQIWAAGGTPSSEIDGLRRLLRHSGTVDLLIVRNGETQSIVYRAPALKIDYQYLFLSSIGFLYLAIGLYTFMRSARGESTLFFFLTLLAFIVYVYSPAGDVDTSYKTLLLVEEFARIFLPPLTLHFFIRFPRPLWTRRMSLAAIYALPVVLSLWVCDLYGLGNLIPFASLRASLIALDRLEMLQFAAYLTIAFVALTYTFRTAPAIGEKKQIKWIYLGISLGFLPFVIFYLVPFVLSGAAWTPYTTIAIVPLAFVPLAFAVSILKYKLWDVEVVIKEILAYSVTFLFGIIAFSTINLLLSRFVEEALAIERNFLAFTSGLLIAAVLVPVKSRIESMIEMVLYRDTYRHRRTIVDFATELAAYHDLSDLLEKIGEKLAVAMRVDRTNLYVRSGESFVLYSQERGLPERILEEDFGGRLLKRPLILASPRLPERSDASERLLNAGYRYAFPLRHRNELLGILVCTSKKEDEPLSRDDLQLLGSLMAPVGLAIENARLYGRLRRQLNEIGALKEYNENVIESSSSAIVVVTPDGDVLTANGAFWALVATTPDNVQRLDVLFPPFRELRRSLGKATQLSFVNQRGEERHVNATASAFSAGEAADGTTVIVLTDITERVRLERELQEKDRLASLGLLAAGVAHEVNTPLTGISSYAQLLLADTSPDDPRYQVLKKMEQQTFRASRIVNNLLDLAANRRRNVEPLDLKEIVQSTLAIHEDLFRSKQITVDTTAVQNVCVFGNFSDLQQVLTNLLLNARDAVSRSGHIWIAARQNGDRAVLEVRDDGRGIDPSVRDEIFKPLVTTKRATGGTGIGLAICQRVVESMGGLITVDSEPEKGATFSVSLPLHRQDESRTLETPNANTHH